jgi:hypothetical protein
MRDKWAGWNQEERDRARGRRMAERAQRRILDELDAIAAGIHATNLTPRVRTEAAGNAFEKER